MFWKIVSFNYSETEIGMFTWWSDELMKDLDNENASNLEWDSTGEFEKKIHIPFDFEDPPECSF